MRKVTLMMILIVVSFCIVGCISPGDLRLKKPTLELKSQFDARRVSSCIAIGLKEIGRWMGQTIPVGMIVLDDGYSIDMSNNGVTAVLVDVKEQIDGSTVTRYWGGFRSSNKVVSSCQY